MARKMTTIETICPICGTKVEPVVVNIQGPPFRQFDYSDVHFSITKRGSKIFFHGSCFKGARRNTG